MLTEQISALESSSRNIQAAEYRAALAEDVRMGTAMAFRLLRPLETVPSGSTKVGDKVVYSPIDVLAEHRAIWAKWWQEGANIQDHTPCGDIPLGDMLTFDTIKRGAGSFKKAFHRRQIRLSDGAPNRRPETEQVVITAFIFQKRRRLEANCSIPSGVPRLRQGPCQNC